MSKSNYGQNNRNYWNTQTGFQLDGKGDLFGQNFTTGFIRQIKSNRSWRINYEYFVGNYDDNGYHKHRGTNGIQVLYGLNSNIKNKIVYELLFGGQYKHHRWKYSSNNGFMVIGTNRGILNINPGETKVYKEGSIGYSVATQALFKVTKIVSFQTMLQYQNDNSGYSVLAMKLGLRIEL